MSTQKHGSISSYIIGYLLALACTAVPYTMVINKRVTGNTLLATILVFAFIQMLIQVIFFLHIGRGPKPNWNLFFFAATVGIILVIVGGSILIINNLHYNMSSTDITKKLLSDEGISQVNGNQTGACQELHTNHKVVIVDGEVSPLHIAARKCDTLTFINEDNQIRDISFGAHPAHLAYAGVVEINLRKGYGQTITLSETGSYTFHDHLHEETAGYFTVEP